MPLKLPKVYSYVFNLLKTMLVINSHLNNCVRKNGVTITTKKMNQIYLLVQQIRQLD